jgi:hypothetical protein
MIVEIGKKAFLKKVRFESHEFSSIVLPVDTGDLCYVGVYYYTSRRDIVISTTGVDSAGARMILDAASQELFIAQSHDILPEPMYSMPTPPEPVHWGAAIAFYYRRKMHLTIHRTNVSAQGAYDLLILGRNHLEGKCLKPLNALSV